ncbi:uncharacterized protein LOC108682165 isoform X2 [Hyalella azteca]|uniref:Uncharacterized protein LOC108682165 isoform X2 n=1 Tax=Hyalella azteca TaxID=294128 RepID=A0A8B7PKR7_HYAAZ|nr:uncharacterized protein LOC108682165 isoform X2 [Hyalella azteca]
MDEQVRVRSFAVSKTRQQPCTSSPQSRAVGLLVVATLLLAPASTPVAAESPQQLLQTPGLRVERAAFSPPTVTSVEPHRRGISSIMHDSNLRVGRQSEGPYHPSYMRKAPYRQQSSTLISDEENLSRPPTMYRSPDPSMDFQTDYEDTLQDGSQPQAEEYTAGAPILYGSHKMDSNDAVESLVSDRKQTLYVADLVRVNDDNPDDARSRQRRVESSSSMPNGERFARHGRFGEAGGVSESDEDERFDTFGKKISEELWVGPRRSASPVHPSARAVRPKNRSPSPSNGESEGKLVSSRLGFRNGNTAIEVNDNSLTTNHEEALQHPGSRMLGRSSLMRPGHNRGKETVIIRDQAGGHVSNPRMLRHRPQNAQRGSVQSTLSITDVMVQTNQTYDQFLRNLSNVGISLAHFLRVLNDGASMEDVLRLLNFPEPNAGVPTTTIPPHAQRKGGRNWEENLHNEDSNANGKRRQGEEFSDSVYSAGVHPVNRHSNDVYGSEFITESGEIINMPDYTPDTSYEDYYSEDPDDGYETKLHARVHTFKTQETSNDVEANTPRNKFILDEPVDPHPNYNQWDQISDYNYNTHEGMYDAVNTEETLAVREQELRVQPAEPTLEKKPLTYAVIAASAIMGSLAVFTFFVLIAYTIVKCTRKPTLNNYQVSDKKPVEVAST